MINHLREFFYNRETGPGIWKWDHYFDIYERHFSRFRGTECVVVEIGIYSGGSLDMWNSYFGPWCKIIGVDIQPECKVYERENVQVFIGNQAEESFWHEFNDKVDKIDIVIDDGSHKARHQELTFQQLFPRLSRGGIYLCEDIHGYPDNKFANYMSGYACDLNNHQFFVKNKDNNDRRLTKQTTNVQRMVKSVSFYPYVVVVEKNETPVEEFVAPKRGDQWQPFVP